MAGVGTAHLKGRESFLLTAENLVVEYPAPAGRVKAVSDLSLGVHPGMTLGLVGESGCGKSTAGRALGMLVPPDSGSITFDGQLITGGSPKNLRGMRSKLQMVFQDPVSSLNPRRRVRDLVAEGLVINKFPKPWDALVAEALDAVGIEEEVLGDRYPHELSGGQAQRVALARALVLEPLLIICDEPVSALDISVQAQVLNLLERLKGRYALTLVFIAHDLAVVKNISDHIAVMYLGRLCEVAPSDDMYAYPQHPYTIALLDSVPEPSPDATLAPIEAEGEPPSPVNPPAGCRFRTRCPRVHERCKQEVPEMREVAPGHFVACHLPTAELS